MSTPAPPDYGTPQVVAPRAGTVNVALFSRGQPFTEYDGQPTTVFVTEPAAQVVPAGPFPMTYGQVGRSSDGRTRFARSRP